MHQEDRSQYSVYKTVIEKVLKGDESLPSLPSITLRVRQELTDPNTTHSRLAMLIERDPALTALIIKNASNPMFLTASKSKDLEAILPILGMKRLDQIVMLHSIRSLYTVKGPELKRLYKAAWKRLITKAVVSTVFARLIKHPKAEEVMVTSLLTEIGTLAVLSALNESPKVPQPITYIRLCREYSKSLGVIILNKWGLDYSYVDALKRIGRWDQAAPGNMDLVDVLNIGLYQSILWHGNAHDLPQFDQIKVYQKLPPSLTLSNERGIMQVLMSRRDEIREMLNVMI